MKMHCAKRCIKAYNKIQETTLLSTIKDFLNGADLIFTNPDIFQQFYDYIQMKYAIPCEIGMLFIEKITMGDSFNDLFNISPSNITPQSSNNPFLGFKIKVENLNYLTNDKVKLYQWIKPSHFEINSLNFSDVISCFVKIKNSTVPSVKIFHLMTGITKLYNKIGKTSGFDTFFPYLVFCLIKSNIKDLYAHIHYMNIFKRKFYNCCEKNCNHGFQICVSCDCLISQNWSNEEEFYLTASLAAVDYISKLEYYNLKIGMDEFEREISKSLKKINLKD